MDPDPFARIVFSRHALRRCNERLDAKSSRDDRRGEIRVAFLEGRWSREQPAWCVTDGFGPHPTVDGVVYAWPESRERVWVVVLGVETATGVAGASLVKTVLRGKPRERDPDLHHLRPGLVRR